MIMININIIARPIARPPDPIARLWGAMGTPFNRFRKGFSFSDPVNVFGSRPVPPSTRNVNVGLRALPRDILCEHTFANHFEFSTFQIFNISNFQLFNISYSALATRP